MMVFFVHVSICDGDICNKEFSMSLQECLNLAKGIHLNQATYRAPH